MTENEADYIEQSILKFGLKFTRIMMIYQGFTVKEVDEIHQEMLDAGWNPDRKTTTVLVGKED